MEQVLPQPALKAPGRRKSVFLEVGLVDEETLWRERSPAPALVSDRNPRKSRARAVRFRSKNDIFQERDDGSDDNESASDSDSGMDPYESTQLRSTLVRPKVYRLGFLAVILGLILLVFQTGTVAPMGVKGGVIPRESIEYVDRSRLEKREDTQTEVCTRWSGQCK